MNIRKYMLRSAVALLAFALSYAAFVQYRFVRSLVVSRPITQTIVPLAEMDAGAFANVEYHAASAANDTEVPSPVNETNQPFDFDPTGYYLFLDYENPPAGFEDFEYIEIVAMDYEPDAAAGTPIPPKGGVMAKRMYKFKTVAISPTNIAFETETVKGISYTFVGTFPHARVDERCPDSAASLTGLLTKSKNGKRITADKVEFQIECGC